MTSVATSGHGNGASESGHGEGASGKSGHRDGSSVLFSEELTAAEGFSQENRTDAPSPCPLVATVGKAPCAPPARLILASGSPRRLELLRAQGIEPEVIVPQVDEGALVDAWDGEDVGALAQELALAKATEVQRRLAAGQKGGSSFMRHKGDGSFASRKDSEEPILLCPDTKEPPPLCPAVPTAVLAADTIVYGNRILGKPRTEDEALAMLMSLCNTTHSVYTGAVLLNSQNNLIIWQICERTEVGFGDYRSQTALDYIRAERPYDMAGSYAIQGSWRRHVVSIKGDYNNVVGLPTRVLQAVRAATFLR
ncbi:MAG: Maf family protein [Coriobacteriales bacterium]|jgi:septum formation protein|nr:Maf family protein [Coriobacteriales bacterium]